MAMPSQLTEQKTPTILSFFKAPRVGDVKTRLAHSIGSESALLVYRTLVERQLTQLPKNYPLEIHYAPEDALQEMRDWLGDGYTFNPQCEGGLGMRLEHAVVDAFKRGAKSVICIGGDCPKLNHVHLEQTAVALNSDYDVVFGPSEDGGYYLIGLNAPYPELFRSIPWSTATTLDESLKQAAKLELRVLRLETLYDVDEIAELNRAMDEGLIGVNSVGK
jgi:rSAM/selenodomain-associated transferase 1